MLGLVLTLILVWLALAVLLWGGSLFLQAYIYSEPGEGLLWRGPVAGTALALYFALWCYLAYRSPQLYGGSLDFSAYDIQDVDKFLSVKRKVGQERGQEIPYQVRKTGSARREFYDVQSPTRLWKRNDTEGIMEAVIVELDGQPVRLQAELTKEGTFASDAVRYLEVGGRGRYMNEGELGRIYVPRPGRVPVMLLLNALHLAVWFLCLWLVLRYQWSHALGLAVACWLVMTFLVLPMLFSKTEDLAQQRLPARPTALTWPVSASVCHCLLAFPSPGMGKDSWASKQWHTQELRQKRWET